MSDSNYWQIKIEVKGKDGSERAQGKLFPRCSLFTTLSLKKLGSLSRILKRKCAILPATWNLKERQRCVTG